jgi:hypothetical protein
METQKVVITGIEIPFRDLVVLLVKVSFAAIPAGIIVGVVYFFVWYFLANLLSFNRGFQ